MTLAGLRECFVTVVAVSYWSQTAQGLRSPREGPPHKRLRTGLRFDPHATPFNETQCRNYPPILFHTVQKK